MTEIKIILLSSNAKIPFRNTKFSAGLDLYSAEKKVIKPNKNALLKTDLAIQIEQNCVGHITGTSGLALKQNLIIHSGTLDADYTGNVGVIIHNINNYEITIELGQKIAQLIVSEIKFPNIKIVKKLDETERGQNGFGSSDN